MYEQFFRHLVFPTLDRLNRTRITHILRTLQSTEHCSMDELLNLQRQKLAKILDLTQSSSEF